MPSPISVNMLGLRLTSEVQKRSKNGRPQQSTTGVASTSSSQGRRGPSRACKNGCGQIILPMATANRGMVKIVAIQKRNLISRNSGFSFCREVKVRDSSAMPQMGHDPGWDRTISGCIGQVYSVPAVAGNSGSNAMPQDGQAPGLDSRTSGHMG